MNPTLPNSQNLTPESNLPNVSNLEIVGLYSAPVELAGVMDPNAWNMMSDEQKIQILMQTGLTRYLRQKESIPETVNVATPSETIPQIQEQVPALPEKEPAKEEVQIVREEKPPVAQPILEEVNVSKFDPKKVFGYTPQEDTIQNAEEIANSGPVEKSKTWAATIVSKALQALFG